MYSKKVGLKQRLAFGLIFVLVLTACMAPMHKTKQAQVTQKQIPTRDLNKSIDLKDSSMSQKLRADSLKMLKSNQNTKADSLKNLLDSTQTDSATRQRIKDLITKQSDSLVPRDSLSAPILNDSLSKQLLLDSLRRDSIQADSIKNARLVNDSFDDIVAYTAQDSVVMIGSNLAYLFGASTVDYKNKGIESNFMRMNIDSNLVYAHYILDSLGRPTAHPKFKDGGETYEAKSMNYNFSTSKGFITGVVTKQGEGYVTAEKTKKTSDKCMYMQGGRYTTCQDHEHPHFYLKLTKAKVRNGKNIVAGPSYLVIGDVPLPIGLPFGFFPFTSKYSSGIIMPKYGEETNKGFYLRDGGYYWAINDYIDLSVTGDWYSLGSWGVRSHSNYRKRYSFSGSFDLSYIVTKRGDKDVLGDFTSNTDFRINWSHSQDSKSNPNQTFSASVNFSTSNYNHNSLNTLYNPNLSGQNTKSSTINYSRSFPGTPWRLSASANVSQTSSNKSISMSLPNISVSMSRIYPFKRKNRIGKERWYEKISMSYSGQFRNSISTTEDKILKSNFLKDWRNGIQHSIPISASYKLFDYIDLTFSASYNERWYSYKTLQSYNPKTDKVEKKRKYGFNRSYDFSTSMSMSTTLYGFFKPWSIFGDKVQMIRHRMNPRISLSYRPDFGDERWGTYKPLAYTSKSGELIKKMYNLYEGQIYGSASPGQTAAISFGVDNNLEAKIKTKQDSVETFKKVSLIDNFSLSASYNFAADSFQLSDISTRISLKLMEGFTLSLGGSFDPYMYGHTTDKSGYVRHFPINKLRMFHGRGLGGLRSTGTSFSYTFNNQTIDKIKGWFRSSNNEDKNPENNNQEKPQGLPNMNKSVGQHTDDTSLGDIASSSGGGGSMYGSGDDTQYDSDGYEKYSIPWSFSVNYGVNFGRKDFDPKRDDFNYGLTHSLMFSGNISPTKNWSFNFNASYDFMMKKVTNMTIGISRDLHCWKLTASAIPMGPYKSYNLTIGVKSSLLQDLKYDKQSYPSADNWY